MQYYILLLISVCFGFSSAILVEPEWQIYYDLRTNKTIDTVDSSNPRLKLYKRQQNKILRIGFGPIPCSCEGRSCGCCTGMKIENLNFNRRACMNFTYDPQDFALNMNMLMDDESLFSNTISGKNPPPLCMSIPFPFLPSVDFCVRLFNIHTPGYNIFMCMDFLTRIERAPLLILHFDCMQLGQDGVSYHKPDETEIEEAEESETIPEDEIFDPVVEEADEMQKTTQQPNKSLLKGDGLQRGETAVGSDVYDEVIDDGDNKDNKENVRLATNKQHNFATIATTTTA